MTPRFMQKFRLEGGSMRTLYVVAIYTVSAYCTLLLLIDLSQIEAYRHDSVYYIGHDNYFKRVQQEGRWLTYLLYPVFSNIPGVLASFLNILFLFLFVFVVCNRWVKSASYAILMSLLAIQISPLIPQLMWPAAILPAFVILLLAAIIAPRIHVYLFYMIFGMLFFGTLSYLYYLLPLVHLPILNSLSLKKNSRNLFITIIPAWAVGFISGYLFALFIVFLLTGQIGLKIHAWRRPNYINDYQDLLENIARSFSYFVKHTSELFNGIWRNILLSIALIVGVYSVNKSHYVPLLILSLGMIVVHYVVIIPVGITVDFRTVLPVWLGILVFLLFYPDINRWQYYCIIPVIMSLILSFYYINHDMLKWYNTVTNVYQEEIKRSIKLDPDDFIGVALNTDNRDVASMTLEIGDRLQLKRGFIENIANNNDLMPFLREAGFKHVLLCKSWHKKNPICINISESIENQTQHNDSKNMFIIEGEFDGYLIVSINKNYYKHKTDIVIK